MALRRSARRVPYAYRMIKLKLLILSTAIAVLAAGTASASTDPHLLKVASAQSFASDYLHNEKNSKLTFEGNLDKLPCQHVGTTTAYRKGHVDCKVRQVFYVFYGDNQRARKRNEWVVYVTKSYNASTRRTSWTTSATIDGPFSYPYSTGLITP